MNALNILVWSIAVADTSRLEAIMKAIWVHEFGGPEVLKLEEVPDLHPGPGQVVVQVRAVGVNPVEVYVRAGTYAMKPTLPYTPGTDAAGVVASVGEGVAGVKVGDRVYASGSLVMGTAGTDAGLKLVKEQGAHHAVNHNAAGYLDELMKLTGERGFDLIIEMLANKNLANDLGLLAKKGRVVVVGSRGSIEINPRDAMSREADIRGMTLGGATEQELRDIHAALGAGLENGTLRPVIGKTFPLAEAARAHEEIMKPSGALGKIVLVV